MSELQSLQSALSWAVEIFIMLLRAMIFVRIILSWVPGAQRSQIAHVVRVLTEPILGPVRAMLDRSPLGGRGMILDFSPLIALLLLSVIELILKILIGAIPV